MKGYKAFEKGLVCRGKQYAENTVFEEENAEICKSGMHFCKRPLDVLRYYSPCDDNGILNEFCEVEALDEALTDDNVKYCTKKLKVGAKIGIVGLIKAEVEYIKQQIEETPEELKSVNSGYSSSAVNSGAEGVAIALGIESKAKAALGGWIVLAEWKYDKTSCQWHRINLKSAEVDGERIKADTFYKLENGNFKEVEGED